MAQSGAASPRDGDQGVVERNECVRVVVRCRPLSGKEKGEGFESIVEMDPGMGQVRVKNPQPKRDGERSKAFTFDAVFDIGSGQEQVYEETARPIVDSVMQGYNGTIFAYGQTGTGKTFTMEGVESPPDLRGVVPRAFEHVFNHIAISSSQDKQYLVRASFLEIYNDAILDLLSDSHSLDQDRLELKEHPDSGVYVKGLRTQVVHGVPDLMELLEQGKAHRRTGETKMNVASSRSHCIFTITVETSETFADGENHIRVGKLNMVDLAGSERQQKTEATGVRLKEATKINLSLSALGNVISALTSSHNTHIPYRDSKLTRLLQDSLGGNTKTVMIANIGPATYNFEETISTLYFANRAKNIQNKPRINEDPKDTMLREFQEQIAKLKAELAATDGGVSLDGSLGGSRKVVVDKVVQRVVVNGVSEEQVQELERKLAEEVKNYQLKSKEERDALLQQRIQVEQEAQRLRESLRAGEQQMHATRQSKQQLQDQLKQVQANLLTSRKLISDSERQKAMLRQKKVELHQRKLEAERVERQLKQRAEAQLELHEKYDSQDKELEAKNRKLDALREKYQEVKEEIEDLQAENQREREEMLETIREMTRHIQLKELIIRNFVPNEEASKVHHRAHWDDEHDQWLLAPIDMETLNLEIRRPGSAKPNQPRPVTELARVAQLLGDNNPRFRRDNIIELGLDMPERTTQDYELLYEADQPSYYDHQQEPVHDSPRNYYNNEAGYAQQAGPHGAYGQPIASGRPGTRGRY